MGHEIYRLSYNFERIFARQPVVKKVDQLDKPLKFAIQNKIIVEREAEEVNKTLPKLKQKNEW